MSPEAADPRAESQPAAAVSRRALLLAAALLVGAAGLVYGNSFAGVMLFDDQPSLIRNPTIRHLADLGQVLAPPPDCTVSGRPVANLTLAVNYAVSGLEPWSYHAVNLLIHVLAGLLLWGVVRRTLLLPALSARYGAAALPLATAVAGLWLLHPLQTEAVTYLIQRVEALGGLFYLLTLYGFIRSLGSPAGRGWRLLAVGACILGVGTKEIVASAPLFVLFYDRTLVAGSFAEAWRRRRGLYLGLAATWVPLALLVASAANRSGTAGFGTASSWDYLLTQCRALVHYLRLCFWPQPLVFDYGWELVRDPLQVLPQALLLTALAGATVWATVRRSAWALPGAWFFAILAPSSSIVPVASQTMAEHRMYLPLAAVLGVAVIGGYTCLAVWPAVAVALGGLTVHRNEVYRSELAMAQDTAGHRPDNPRALTSLGMALFHAGRTTEALPQFARAVALEPNYPHARITYGATLIELDRPDEARVQCEAALRLWPNSPDAYHNLGLALYGSGRTAEAIAHYETALRLQPDFPEAEADLGLALSGDGRLAEAVGHYERALRLNPNLFAARNNLGTALLNAGRYDEARSHLEAAVRLRPDSAEAGNNLGLTLYAVGRNEEAAARFTAALRLNPAFPDAHNNLGLALEAAGRLAEARACFQEALRLRPDFASARENLARIAPETKPVPIGPK